MAAPLSAKNLLLLLCWVGGLLPAAWAQSKYTLPGPVVPEYGVLSASDFEMSPADTAENDYRYLYKGMEVRFEVLENRIHALITHHIRVRVQTMNGTLASFVSIPLYADNDLETLESIEGRTWTSPRDWASVDTSTRRIVNVNERYAITEYTMPMVKPGVVMDYRYTVRRRYLEELPDFYLMMSQPVDLAMVRIVNSTFLRYKAIPVHTDDRVQMYEARVDTGVTKTVFAGRLNEPLLVQAWHARNVPALREEPLSGSLDDYRWRIKFQWAEFGNPRQFLERGWDVVAAELRRRPGLESNIARYTSAKGVGDDFRRRFPDPAQRTDSLYAWLRDRANPSVNRGITAEEDPSVVVQGRPATHALVNQALIALLRASGLKAWPLLTASRDYGKILADFPSYYQFNRLLVYVELENGHRILDASDPFAVPGLVPEDVLGSDGFLLRPEDYEWVKLTPEASRSELTVDLTGRLSADGTLVAHLSSRHFGYKGRQFLESYSRLPDAEALAEEMLFRNTNRVAYRRAQVVGARPDDSTGLELDVEIPRFAVSFSEGVEFGPMIVGWLEANPIGEGPRNLPVDLNVPESFVLTAAIKVPSGYRMPEPSGLQEASLPGALLRVAYNMDGDTLRYRVDIRMDAITVPPEDVREIRQFYEHWVALSGSRWFLSRRRGS